MEFALYPIKLTITGMPHLWERLTLGVIFTTIIFLLDVYFGRGQELED